MATLGGVTRGIGRGWTFSALAVFAILLLLAGCGEDAAKTEAVETATTKGSQPVMLATASGTPRSADGTWYFCYYDSNTAVMHDVREVWAFTGSDFTFSEENYVSTTGTCSGAPTSTATPATGTVSVAGTKTVYWYDGVNIMLDVPAAGGGLLPNAVTATMIQLNVPSGIYAGSNPSVAYIDDTSTNLRWPNGSNSGGIACTPDPQGFPRCLFHDYKTKSGNGGTLTPGRTAAPLGLNTPMLGNVNIGGTTVYATPVLPGSNYTVSITGLSSDVDLDVSHDGSIPVTSNCNLVDNTYYTTNAPEDCTLTASSGMLFPIVNGFTTGNYTVLVHPPVPPGTATQGTIGTPVMLTKGVPFTGQVTAGNSSFYMVSGLSGNTRISVTGMTGAGVDADLYVYSDPGFTAQPGCTLDSTLRLNALPEGCTINAPPSTLYIEVFGYSGNPGYKLLVQ